MYFNNIPCEVCFNTNNLKLRFILPGLNMENVKVTVGQRDNTLNISGKLEKPENLKFSVLEYGDFNYTVPLTPFHLDFDKIVSEYDKGILTVTLPLEDERIKIIAVENK